MVERSQSEKRAIFRELHRSGCFVLPNPRMSVAQRLASLGFKARPPPAQVTPGPAGMQMDR